MSKWTNEQMDKCANGQMDKWTNGKMNKWTNEQMDKWTKGKMVNGQMDNISTKMVPSVIRKIYFLERINPHRTRHSITYHILQ